MPPIDSPVPHRRLVFRARTIRALLRELWPVWLVLGVLAAAALVCVVSPVPGTIRTTGLLLQFLGLSVVTTEVIRTWRRARTPAPRDWLRRLASAIRPADTTRAAAPSDRPGGKGVVPASLAKVPAGAGLEQRIRTLEKNVEDLRRELARAFRAQEKALTDVRQMVERDVQARAGAISAAGRSIDDAASAGLPLELVGLAWLGVGLVCVTAAEPMAAVLSWVGR